LGKAASATGSGIALGASVTAADTEAVVGGTSHLVKIPGKLAITTGNAPATASSTGVTGTIAWDSSYIYVCTATNTWKRAAIATW
jgi:hypothetical protein